MDVKKNVPKPDEVLLLKKYIAWHFNQHAKKDPETMCVVLLDMTGASVGNLVSSICTCVSGSFDDDVILLDDKKGELLLERKNTKPLLMFEQRVARLSLAFLFSSTTFMSLEF